MATQGQWQGAWAGSWAGPPEEAPPGSMSGSASFSITAAGTLTNGTLPVVVVDGSGSAAFSITAVGILTDGALQPPAVVVAEPYNPPDDELTVFLARQQREADRIRKQNQAAIALILAAITEGAIE